MTSSLHGFGDQLGRFFERNGMPRIAGRLLAHLLTCEPGEQRFDELVEALGASRSSVSVVTRLLVQLGLVERFGVEGDRRDRYRLREDAWTTLLRQDLEAARQLRALAEEGLALTSGRPPAARARLRGMREFYRFLEAAQRPLIARWERRHR